MEGISRQELESLDVNRVLQLIQGALSGDNERIKQATKLLKAYSKVAPAIRTLTYILAHSPDLPPRQMVAVLLKRNLVQLYSQLPQQQQTEFKNVLLTRYVEEPQMIVKRSIAALVGALMPVVGVGKWTQLQTLLDQALQTAPDSAATFVLLNSVVQHMKPPPALYQYLFKALGTPTLVDEAIKCLVAIVETHDVDASLAVEFIKIWEGGNWSEDSGQLAMEVLTTMVERRMKLPQEVTVWVCDRIVGNRRLSNKMRTSGCDYLFALADFGNKMLASKEPLLKKVVETACLTCSEPYKYNEEDDDKGELVQEIALWLVESLAVEVKPKKIYPVLFEAAVKLINSEDPNQANTGFLVLGAACEGCAEKVKRNLANPIMNVLIPKGLSHQAPEVRGAAINALCYFSEHLVPDIFQYHAVIIPGLVGHLGDLSPKVVGKALIAIDVFFDGMEKEDIVGYLPTVIPKLVQVLHAQAATPLMKAAAISAIGSAVYVSEQQFEPYLQQSTQLCLRILQTPASPELNTVRAENINVLGKMANVFCKEAYVNSQAYYETYVMPIMEQVYLILHQEQDPQIREACFAFFYLIANAIGAKFAIVFDKLVPIVMQACELKPPPPKKAHEMSLDSDSEDENQVELITHKVTEHDQKAAAIHAMGQLAKACPSQFAPHFETAYHVLDQHHQHFYQNIRTQVCHAYTNLTLGLVKSQLNVTTLPTPPKGLPCGTRYPKALQDHFRMVVIAKLVTMMTEDDDKKVRGAAVESIDDLVKELGPAFIDHSLGALKEAIMKLLQAQSVEEEDSEEEQEEEEETDVHTFEALCDLIPTLAENMLAGFEPTLSQLRSYAEREEVNDNVQMTGCLSQCFKWCPGYAANHAQELFRSIVGLTSLDDTEVNRNIAYCLAQMFEKSAMVYARYLQDALVTLRKIYEHPQSEQACKDNALAAICRIIYTHNPPMPLEIFLQGLIAALPFKGDPEQEPSALKALLFLEQHNPNLLIPHKQSIANILQNDLSLPQKYFIKQPLLSQLRSLLGRLSA